MGEYVLHVTGGIRVFVPAMPDKASYQACTEPGEMGVLGHLKSMLSLSTYFRVPSYVPYVLPQDWLKNRLRLLTSYSNLCFYKRHSKSHQIYLSCYSRYLRQIQIAGTREWQVGEYVLVQRFSVLPCQV